MKARLKAAGLHEALCSMSGRGGGASQEDINVARIHAGIFRIMGSMIFNPERQDAA